MSRLVILDEITLDSSNVSASGKSEYDSGTTYSTGDLVKVSYESDGTTPRTPVHEYESLADSNTDNYPLDSPKKWSDLGPSNRWAMFERFGASTTSNSSTIEVEIDASGATCVALFGLNGTQLEITHYDDSTSPRTEIKTETINLLDRNTLTWSDYFFKEFEYKAQHREYLTEYADATLAITITASTTAECTKCLIGSWYDVGSIQWEPQIEIHDYSKKETDDNLGIDYLKSGNYVKKLSGNVWMNKGTYNALYRSYVLIRGTPIVIDMNNESSDFDVLVFFGYIYKFRPRIDNPVKNQYRLEARGIV